jgi:large subunit ribosomal protein L14
MILVGTVLDVADNSGATRARCLNVLTKGRSKVGGIGDHILVSIKQTVSKQKTRVKRGEMYRGLITQTKKGLRRQDGSHFSLSKNALVLVTAQGLPLGSRLLRLATYELRKKKLVKVLSLASHIL